MSEPKLVRKERNREESPAMRNIRNRAGNDFSGIVSGGASLLETLDLLKHEITDPQKRRARSKKPMYLGDRLYDLIKDLNPGDSVKIGPLQNDEEVKAVLRSIGQKVRNRLKWKVESSGKVKRPPYIYEVSEGEVAGELWIILLRLPETKAELTLLIQELEEEWNN